jgi:DNA recombination protein RmuC
VDLSLLIVILVLAAIAVAAVSWGLRQRGRSQVQEHQALTFLQNQVNSLTQQTAQQMEALRSSLQQINSQMLQSLQSTRHSLDQRLEGTGKLFHDIHQQLGRLDQSTHQVLEVGKDVTRLEELLRAPKLRGSIGELFLDDLLSQILPGEHYRMQHRFRDGAIVDAVVIMKAGMVPVDAKFPLENFRRLASVEEEERTAFRKQFDRDVKKHIDEISDKYIRTDEGTFDFALMYIPAENVYYETIIRDTDGASGVSLFQYALTRRVIPVSPNSFYAYLQTILLGLKGMRVEESAREVLDNLTRLRKELGVFQDSFRKLGTHLDHAQKQFDEASRRFGKIDDKMHQIEGVAHGLEPGEQAALEPAEEE